MTLTADPAGAAIMIRITVDAGLKVRGIIRTDANGSRRVRTPWPLPAYWSGFMVRDYEPALSGTVRYDLDDGALGASAEISWQNYGAWLTVPIDPARRLQFDVITELEADRKTTTTFHDIVGRTDPLAVIGGQKLRTGRLAVLANTYDDVTAINSLIKSRQVLMVRQALHAGLDMYFLAENSTEQYFDPNWIVTFDFQEVAWPKNLVAARPEWTFAALKNAYRTFEAVTPNYSTFASLTRNEVL